MRDALGGTVVLSIIVIFIVVALGYMAFNINYMKAFRMKNKVISTIEAYDGVCDKNCSAEIKEYATKIGYTMGQMTCPSDTDGGEWTKDPETRAYCYKEIEVDANKYKNQSSIMSIKSSNTTDIKGKSFYRICTKINIEIPVISRIFDFRLFQITGDTKAFEKD